MFSRLKLNTWSRTDDQNKRRHAQNVGRSCSNCECHGHVERGGNGACVWLPQEIRGADAEREVKGQAEVEKPRRPRAIPHKHNRPATPNHGNHLHENNTAVSPPSTHTCGYRSSMPLTPSVSSFSTSCKNLTFGTKFEGMFLARSCGHELTALRACRTAR